MVFGFTGFGGQGNRTNSIAKQKPKARKTLAEKRRNRKLLFEGLEERRVLTAGILDPTFDTDGIVTTTFAGTSYAEGRATAIQPDGKIVVAGYTHVIATNNDDFAVTRYNSDGSLDGSFGIAGMVITAIGTKNDQANSIVIQPDGKILVAGFSVNASNDQDFAVVRYNPDGSLDGSFGSGTGKVTTAIGSADDVANGLAIQPDGRIILAGFSHAGKDDFAVVRYNPNGSLDTTFGIAATGKVTTDFSAKDDQAFGVVVQPDGAIVLVGFTDNGPPDKYDFALARYTTAGILDATFDGDGKVVTPIGSADDQASSVALQSNGKIVVAGFSHNGGDGDFALARYNSNGSLDTTFDTDGKLTTPIGVDDHANSVAIQPNGKIIAAGFSHIGATDDFSMARYNSNGSLDTTFGTAATGIVTSAITPTNDTANGIALQADGSIVLAGLGTNSFAVARYSGDPVGTISATLDGSGNLTVADTFVTGKNNLFTALKDGSGNLVISDANETFVSAPAGWTLSPDGKSISILASSFTGSITVNAAAGNDNLAVDASMVATGNPIFFNGGNPTSGPPGDSLSLAGPGAFGNIVHTLSNAADGTVNIDGYIVTYTGLEPVTDNLSAATRSFTFNGGSETIALADSGTPGQTIISSTLGESVTFVNPTTSLTVNPGSGVDTVNVTGLGSSFAASLNILGTLASGLTTLGSFAYTNNGVNQPGDSLDVNPNGEVVYIGGNFGPAYAAYRRVQAANPSAMFSDLSAFGQGGGIAVNPVTGRFAVTNGSNLLTVYNPDGTVYDTKVLNGLGGSIAAGNGTFGISTQGTDSFHLYNEAAKTLQVFGGLAVGSRVTYNPGTGYYYMNRTPGQTFFVNEASPATNGLLGSQIFFEAANGVTNRLYAVNSNNVNIYNAAVPNSPPLLSTIAALPAAVQDVAVNTVRDRLYIGLQGTNQILIYSGNGATPLGVYTLPAGNFVQKLDIAPGSDRLYVTAVAGGTNSNLFVLSESGSTINITGTTSTSGAVLISGKSVNFNANLNAGGNVLVTSENISFGNGTLSTGAGNSATLNVANGAILSGSAANDVVAGSISLTAGFGGIGAAGNPLTVSGTNLSSITTSSSSQFLATSGSITIDATGFNAGAGTIQLDAGTFNLGGSNRINDNTKLNVNSATFDIGNNSETVNTLTLTSGSITGSAGVLTSTNTVQTKTGSISASLAGTNGLTQSTGGTTTLTGNNSYTGTTNIDAGTLLVNGINSGTGAVNVNNTGTLGGNGSIVGTVTAASGSIVAPGVSAAVGTIGTLTVGGLVLNSGSTYQVDVTNTPTSDKIAVTGGTLTLTNPTIAVTAPGNLTNSSNQNFRIIQSGTAATGTFNGLPEGSQVPVTGSTVPTYVTYLGGTGSLPGTNVDLNTQPTINGTSGADTLVFNTTATGYTYSLNGGTPVVVNANIPFTFNGGDGDDVMWVNLNTFTLPTAGVFFNGNSQDFTVAAPTPNAGDVLKVVGNGANVEYRAFGTPGTTNKNLNVNTSVGLITATGVEPGDLSGFGTVDVVFSGANEILSIDNGFDATTGLIPALVVTGTTGGNPFEGAHLWSNTQVRILTANTSIGGTDGNDSVTINSASNAHNNTNLWIDTGSGTDTVTVAGDATVSGSVTVFSQNIDFTGGTASATAVVLNAGTGAITTTTNVVDVSATQLSAQATNGIDLDTTVANIQLTNSGAASVNIDETDALNLLGVNVGGSLTIVAGGALTDDTLANTQVTGNANLTAASILLGDAASDSVNFGTLTFTSTGSVTITENSFTNLAGSSSGTAVSLTSTGGIVDGAAATDITASASLIFVATFGVGLGNAVDTATPKLEAQTAAGGLFIDNTGDLTIGGISGLTGLFSSTSPIILNNAGELNISEDVVAQFDFLKLTTIDSALGSQDITVNALVSSGLAVTLSSGDDLLVNAPITAGTTVTGNVDVASADAVGGVVVISAAITAPGGTTLNGNGDPDTFTFNPQTTTAFSVNGFAPLGTLPGDKLVMTVPSGSSLTVTGIGDGNWTFPGGLLPVNYTSIEKFNVTGGPYNLIVDLNNSFNGEDDYKVSLAPGGTQLLVERTGVGAPTGIVHQDNLNVINSLWIKGDNEVDTVLVDDVNGLPNFLGTVALPSGFAVDNANVPGTPLFRFDGGAGTNSVAFQLVQPSSQTYGIGKGDGTNLSDGEVLTDGVNPADLNLYFTGLASVTTAGTPAGSLTILGDTLGNNITVSPNGTSTLVNPLGYATFSFTGNNFSAFKVDGLGGSDSLDLVGFGTSQTNNPTITLDGNAGDDSMTVRSTSGNTGAISLLGQGGNDTFFLGTGVSAADTAGVIAGAVNVDGGSAADNDRLFVNGLGNLAGATVAITGGTPSTIEGLTAAAGTDATFSNINLLDVTASNLIDTITTTLTAPTLSNDLAVVNVRGGGDNDQFYLHIPATPTNTPAGLTNVNLLGDAGNDTFGSSTDKIIPAYSKATGADIFINGGSPDVPSFDPISKNSIDGDKAGDRIYLDMSSATAPVIVDTVTGFADSASHRRLVYNGIEDIDLYDNAGQLQNVHQGTSACGPQKLRTTSC